jgi:hypothetical protein
MTPSLGTMVGLPILLLAALAAVIVGVLLWRYRHRAVDDDNEVFVIASAFGCWVLAAGFLIGTAIGMWPYSSEYHVWRTTTGTVKTMDSRMVSAGDNGMEQRFVVTFADGRQRACDDTRCTTVKPGDVLTLKCKRHYQWGGTPGWDCNWVGNERPGA